MRFETRYDRWLAMLLVVTGALLVGVPLLLMPRLMAMRQPIFMLFFGPVIFVVAIAATLPQYYELRAEGLFICQGWKRVEIPYPALSEVRSWRSALSAPVFSTHRLVVSAVPGGRFVIAVAEEERFFAELAARAPQLEVGPGGLSRRAGQMCG